MDIRSSKLLCTTEGIEIVVYVGLYGAPHLTHDFANPNLVQELVNFCEQRSGSSCSTRSTVETPTSIARRLLITTNLENVFWDLLEPFQEYLKWKPDPWPLH